MSGPQTWMLRAEARLGNLELGKKSLAEQLADVKRELEELKRAMTEKRGPGRPKKEE